MTFYTNAAASKRVGQYPLNYKVDYAGGGQRQAWQEVAGKQSHQSRGLLLEYSLVTEKQEVRVEIDTEDTEEAKTKKSFVG